MVHNLWFCSTQHSVGQGLMHSGVVSAENKPWLPGASLLTTVYDCGTSVGKKGDKNVRIRREVAALRRRSDSLDALYISHFDTDHVSGLPILLHEFTPRLIVIPATTVAERLLRLVHSHGAGGVAELDEVTLSMLVDPVEGITALLSGRETEIVELSPEEDDDFGEAPSPQFREAGDEPNVVYPSATTRGMGAVWADGKLLWIVKPWVERSVKQASVDFLKHLNVKDDDDLKNQLPNWLKSIHTERKRIESAYKQAVFGAKNRSLNLTSLCLYSGPPSSAEFLASKVSHLRGPGHYKWFPTNSTPNVLHKSPGWFGTGDAPFGRHHYVTDFESHYRDVLRLAGQITVPHHGSRADTSDEFVNLFQPGTTWLASAGRINFFNHPHPDTINRICKKGGNFVHVSDDPSTRFTSIDKVTVF